MERLTEQEGRYGNEMMYIPSQNAIYYKDGFEKVKKQTICNRLGEFEDFMEELGLESLDLLKAKLKMKTQSIQGFEKLSQENQSLKDRWNKLKEYVNDYINSMNYTANYSQIETLKGVLNIMQELEKGGIHDNN